MAFNQRRPTLCFSDKNNAFRFIVGKRENTGESGRSKSFVIPACVCQSLSRARLFVTPWTGARQAALSMGFSRQAYWNGLPCPPPGGLADPGIKRGSPALQADSLSLSHLGSPRKCYEDHFKKDYSWEVG